MVLTQTDLVSSALHWDLEYLEKHMGGAKHTVFVSKSKYFMYFDDKKVSNFIIYLKATIIVSVKAGKSDRFTILLC